MPHSVESLYSIKIATMVSIVSVQQSHYMVLIVKTVDWDVRSIFTDRLKWQRNSDIAVRQQLDDGLTLVLVSLQQLS